MLFLMLSWVAKPRSDRIENTLYYAPACDDSDEVLSIMIQGSKILNIMMWWPWIVDFCMTDELTTYMSNYDHMFYISYILYILLWLCCASFLLGQNYYIIYFIFFLFLVLFCF